jgi:DNA-binding winged helix-turn-helix (wHTH) protein/TolB-like protein/tetratricopeptide (TPR) repeat protein
VPTKEELAKGFKLGDWDVVPGRRELHRGDEIVRPEPKQLKVLLSLALRDGDVVTRDELVDECWDGRPTADEPINRSISQLRKHLGDDKPYQYIDAIVKAGYCLKQPVILNEPIEKAVAPVVVIRTRKASRIWAIVASLAIVALIVGTIAFLPKQPVTSIAVLPFDNLSGDPGNAYVVRGFKEELVHTLQNVPELAIKNVQVMLEGKSNVEMGRELGVDNVLVGALRMQGEELKFSYQLVRVDDGVNLAAGQVAGSRSRLFEKQEELAILVWTYFVGDSAQQLLSPSRSENSDAFDGYIHGQYLLERRGRAGNLENAITLFENSIELDPGYGPAYLALAEIYVLLPDYRGADLVESHDKAIQIVSEGIAADPAIEEAAAAVFGFVYHKQKRWIESERAFKIATSASVFDPNAFNWYSLMLGSVGRIDDALQQALAGLEIDPSSAVINGRVAIMYTWTGENEKAGFYFERVRQLGGSTASNFYANALLRLRLGDIAGARALASAGAETASGSDDWVGPVFDAFQDPSRADAALAALDQAAAKDELGLQVDVTVRIILGDVDGALRVARSLVEPGQAFETELLFLPEFMPLRERPEFLELMQTVGVTDYWEQTGCVWENLTVQCK